MKGSCLCGEIEYEISEFNGNIYQCHCSMCRKQGGSASNTGAIVPSNRLRWLKGRTNVRTWVKSTGFTSSFCQNCGSLVPNVLRDLDYYWVPVGALDDGSFGIVANIYLDSKASWGTVSSSGKRFEAMPALDEFLKLLDVGLHGNK